MNCPQRAVCFLEEDSSIPAHSKPLMLEAVLFCPILTWVGDKLQADGVQRFFIVCGPTFAEEVRRCFPADADVIVSEQQKDLMEFLNTPDQVLVLPRADSVEGIKQNYRALGSLLAGNVTGTAAAETVSMAIDSKLAEATAALSGMAAAPDATLLISYPYRMATGDTLEGQLLAQVGFHCSGADYTNWLYPESELRALEPDVIFCAEADEVETVKQSYEYKVVAAVKNDKVMAIDFTAFQNQSLRMFDTLAEMAKFTAAEPAEA